MVLLRDGGCGVGAGGGSGARGWGWPAGSGDGMRSSGPPIRWTATAQTLKAGIRLVGSSAGSVRALALEPPPQWKGAKTTSGRMASVTRAWDRGPATAGGELDDVVRTDPERAGQVGVQLRPRGGCDQLQTAGPAGLGA